jgi:hypothetical protein
MTVTQNNDLTRHVGTMNFNLSSVPNNIKNYIELKWLHLFNLVSLTYPC